MDAERRRWLGQAMAAGLVLAALPGEGWAGADPVAGAPAWSLPPLDALDAFDATGLAALVARRKVSPGELLDRALRRAAAIAPLKALSVMTEEVARAALAKPLSGPFAGVPFLLKDLAVELQGTRTTNGSRFFAEQAAATADGELVQRFKRAGLVIFGKTTCPELGLSSSTESALHGPTRNPWNVARVAGGSSGGAAVAVASGVVPMAHASDGGGSIRIPASCCGLLGLKPSRARVPFPNEHFSGWGGLSTQFAITRSVRDAAGLLDAVAGPAPGAPGPDAPAQGRFVAALRAAPSKLRIAVLPAPLNGGPVDAACQQAVAATIQLCASLGHTVREARPVIDVAAYQGAFATMVSVGIARSLDERAKVLGRPCTEADVEHMTWLVAMGGRAVTATAYSAALDAMDRAAAQMALFHRDYDLLLSPTLAAPPLPLGVLRLDADPALFARESTRFSPYTSLANVTGQPAMSVPLHWTSDGLPVGVMFQGRYGEDALLLALAAQLERAQPWATRRPG